MSEDMMCEELHTLINQFGKEWLDVPGELWMHPNDYDQLVYECMNMSHFKTESNSLVSTFRGVPIIPCYTGYVEKGEIKVFKNKLTEEMRAKMQKSLNPTMEMIR